MGMTFRLWHGAAGLTATRVLGTVSRPWHIVAVRGKIARVTALFGCRIDCFQDAATAVFGERMKEQVEERLRFYDEGVAPTKNVTAMQARLRRVSKSGSEPVGSRRSCS